MLEIYFRSARTVDLLRAGPLGSSLDGFAAALRELGYCRRVGASFVRNAHHLGRWAAHTGLCSASLDKAAVDAFASHLSRCRCRGRRRGFDPSAAARARVFVTYLRSCGVVPALLPPQATTPELVTDFCDWMQCHRGATEATLRVYRRMAFKLVAQLGDDPARYDASGLRRAVREVTGQHGISTARHAATVARV